MIACLPAIWAARNKGKSVMLKPRFSRTAVPRRYARLAALSKRPASTRALLHSHRSLCTHLAVLTLGQELNDHGALDGVARSDWHERRVGLRGDTAGPEAGITVSLTVQPAFAEPGDTVRVTVTAVPTAGVAVAVIRVAASGLISK